MKAFKKIFFLVALLALASAVAALPAGLPQNEQILLRTDPPRAPENLSLVMDGDTATLTWDAVTEDINGVPLTPEYYVIYVSSDPLGPYSYQSVANGLSYIHTLVGTYQDKLFYRVTAYVTAVAPE